MSRLNQSVRRERYKKLKNVGFSSKLANKYKDLSNERVEQICLRREKQKPRVANMLKDCKEFELLINRILDDMFDESIFDE